VRHRPPGSTLMTRDDEACALERKRDALSQHRADDPISRALWSARTLPAVCLVVTEPIGAISIVDSTPDGLDAPASRTQSMAAFVALHYERLVGLAGLVCGDLGSAEDIVQTALERAWRSREALQDDARLRQWLDRIVVREAARERRYHLKWIGRILRPAPLREIDAPGDDLIDGSASRFTERSGLREAFSRLSPAHRAVVALVLHEGYSIDEAAGILGVPRDTVRSRLRAAREQLRRALEGGDR